MERKNKKGKNRTLMKNRKQELFYWVELRHIPTLRSRHPFRYQMRDFHEATKVKSEEIEDEKSVFP